VLDVRVYRVAFLPALLALFVRARVRESEVWRETRHDSWTGLGRAIAQNLPLFGYITILMWMMNMVSHGTQDMYPTFLQRHWGFTEQQRGDITIVSMVGALVGGIAFGFYSDRSGRRRTLAIALCAAVLAIPLWAFAPTVWLLVVGAFLMQFLVQGAWGVIPAHITELSPDSVRGFLPGFAYQCGVALAGAIGWRQARLAERLDYAWAMALTAATVFLLGALVARVGPERRGVAFGRGAP
jgi:SHS family lactate transporter-like MFS transporter